VLHLRSGVFIAAPPPFAPLRTARRPEGALSSTASSACASFPDEERDLREAAQKVAAFLTKKSDVKN
jgi:hypothetical protein